MNSTSLSGQQRIAVNNQALGTAGMVCSPLLFLSGLIGSENGDSSRLGALLGLLFLVGWMCSAMGLRLLKVTGSGTAGRVLFGIQLVGLLAASQQVQDMTHQNTNTLFYRIADTAWPFSVLFMLVIGFFTLRAKVWTGWQSFTPLLCGLTLPFFFLVTGLISRQAGFYVFGIYSVAAWMLLGYTVHTAGPTGDL